MSTKNIWIITFYPLLVAGVPIIFPIIGYFAFTKTVTIGDYSVVKSDFLAESM